MTGLKANVNAQIKELKAKYPGVLLIVEVTSWLGGSKTDRPPCLMHKSPPLTFLVCQVGYKMRFFGDDAEVAAKVGPRLFISRKKPSSGYAVEVPCRSATSSAILTAII